MTTTVQTVFIMSPEEVRQMFREEVAAALLKEQGELITYAEIKDMYNVSTSNISRKVNDAKLITGKAHYKGRLRTAISRIEAERMFKLK